MYEFLRFQNRIVTKRVVGEIPFIVSPLNAKTVAMTYLNVIKHMLRLICDFLKENNNVYFYELSHSIQI